MSEFKVKFRGVRGSFPVCNENYLKFGGNTSCVELTVGNNRIILDAGTGIVGVGDDMMEKYISSSPEQDKREPMNAIILLSHIHQDHLLGLTFFKPIHVKSSKFTIYGSDKNLYESLSNMIFGRTFPLDLGDIACNMDIRSIKDSDAIVIKPNSKPELVESASYIPNKDDILITFYKSYVHPQEGVMIYKISYKGKSVVYATDKECYMGGDKKFVKFAKDCDLLIHDAQYTTEDYLNPYSPKQGFGHSTYDMAVEVMKQSYAKKLVFFHYDPSYDDDKLSLIKDYYCTGNNNIIMSQEGLEIDLI